MTEKPKKLKEIEFLLNEKNTFSIDLITINNLLKKELKKEAIKWIKFLESNKRTERKLNKKISLYCNYESTDIIGAVKWITYFFNITEEELK